MCHKTRKLLIVTLKQAPGHTPLTNATGGTTHTGRQPQQQRKHNTVPVTPTQKQLTAHNNELKNKPCLRNVSNYIRAYTRTRTNPHTRSTPHG